jgi:hypothetical protein
MIKPDRSQNNIGFFPYTCRATGYVISALFDQTLAVTKNARVEPFRQFPPGD